MIKQLQLKNFRSHELTNMELAPFTVLLGAMGVGKTSILHAISLLLCGQNPLVNAKSEGLRREIRLGETEFHIGLKLSDGSVIEKKVTEAKHSVGLNGTYGDVRVQGGKILGKLGVELADVVLCLLDPTRFFTRDEKTQHRVLMTFMSQKTIEAPQLTRELRIAESFSSIGQIDALIKELKDEKIRNLNREIKTLNAQIPAPIDFNPKQKAALDARVRELSGKRDGILKSQARDEEWKKSAKLLEDRLAGLPAPDPAVSIESLEAEEKAEREKVIKVRDKWTALRDKRNPLVDKHTEILQEAKRLTHVKETLEGLGKQCPTCQRDLKAAEKKQLVDDLAVQIKKAETTLVALEKDIDALTAELKQVEADGNKQREVVEAAAKRRTDVSSQISAYQQAKKAVDDHKATQPKDTNWPKELAAVASDLAAANMDLLAEQKKEEDSSRRDLQVASVRSKESEAEKLDSAAKELAALKDKILSESSGGFIESMQDFLDHFDLGEVKFSLDPFGFSVGDVYADQLSGGQKVILEAALRQAAAKASGLNMMALDDANMLTTDVRQKMAGVLMSDSVQVIVCSMTNEEPKIAAPLPPNVKMFWLTSPGLIGPTSVKAL